MPYDPKIVVPDRTFPLSGVVSGAPLVLTEQDRESLFEALARVPDPRRARGVRYPVAATRHKLGFTRELPGTVTI